MTIRPGDGIELILYPDNQPQVRLEHYVHGDVDVVFPVQNSVQLLQLQMVADALWRIGANQRTLTIPYLMGARSDKYDLRGQSLALGVVADNINYCRFDRVEIFDVHSDAALLLIHNSTSILPTQLTLKYEKEHPVLIFPDAGATKKPLPEFGWGGKPKEFAYCVKHRNPTDGKIELKMLNPEICKGRNCVIVDDICDGGATFLEIAKQVDGWAHLTLHITLIVSHGIFSKGTRRLTNSFDQVITSDSYDGGSPIDDPKVTVVKLNL